MCRQNKGGESLGVIKLVETMAMHDPPSLVRSWMRMILRTIVFSMLAGACSCAAQAQADVCPLVIGVAADGSIYDLNAINMPALRRSAKVLEQTLHGGCYNDANPSPITSVTLDLAPTAPKESVDRVYAIFARAGWPKERVKKELWSNAPMRPKSRSRD